MELFLLEWVKLHPKLSGCSFWCSRGKIPAGIPPLIDSRWEFQRKIPEIYLPGAEVWGWGHGSGPGRRRSFPPLGAAIPKFRLWTWPGKHQELIKSLENTGNESNPWKTEQPLIPSPKFSLEFPPERFSKASPALGSIPRWDQSQKSLGKCEKEQKANSSFFTNFHKFSQIPDDLKAVKCLKKPGIPRGNPN